MNATVTVAEFKSNIKDELELCSPLSTPWVCGAISEPDGYGKVERLVMDLVLQEKISIGMAITQVENLYNPNSQFD